MRDRATARADLNQLDAGNEDRQTGAALETFDARAFETVRDRRLAAHRDAGLGGGATHVESEDLFDIVLPRSVQRRDHAGGRTRFQQQDRRFSCRLPRN